MYNLAIRELNDLVISGNDPNAVSEDRAQYETSLQEAAGEIPSTDFATVRESLAVRQRDEDMALDLAFTEAALRSGKMTPEVAAQLSQLNYGYNPGMALERAAGEAEAAKALAQNSDQAQIAYADADGFIEDWSRKNAATIGLIQYMEDLAKNKQGVVGDTLDFLRTVVDPGFHQLGVASGYSKTLVGEDESVFKTSHGLSKTIRSNLDAMKHAYTATQYETAMEQIKKELAEANPNTWILEDLIDAVRAGNNITDAMGAIEAVGIAKGVGKALAKGVNKAIMRKTAADAVRNATNTEKLAEVLPTAVKPVEQEVVTSSHSVAKHEIAEEIYKIADDNMLIESLEEGEQEALKDYIRAEGRKTWGMSNDAPVDVSLDLFNDGTGLATIKVGGANGEGMALETALKRQKYLADKGIDSEVTRDGTGSYLEFKQAVDGTRQDAFIENVNGTDQWTTQDGMFGGITNWFNRHFKGSTNLSEVAHAKDVQAMRVHSAQYNQYYKTKKDTYDKLDKYQKALCEHMHRQEVNNNVWYSDDVYRNAGMDDSGVAAMHAYRNMEDLVYVLDNMKTVRSLNKEGNKLYSSKYIGKEVPSVSLDYSKSAIIDETGQLMDKSKLVTNASEYTFVKLKEGLNNVNATHLAIRKGSENVAELPRNVLPYLAGGRRQYLKGTQFVRVLGHVKDELGHKVAQRVRVFTTARTAEEAARYVDEINSVVKIIKEVGNDSLEGARRLKDLDLQYFRVNSWDQIKEMMEAGILDADSQAKFMTHGKKFIPDSTDIIENTEDFALDLLKTREIFNSHRGNLLDDVFGNDALTYSMDEMFNKAVARAASLGARSDLLEWYKKSLRTYINKGMFKNGDRLKELSPEQLIKEAVMVDRKKIADVDLQDYRAAENMLLHARRICGAKTPGDTAIERFMASVAEHVYPVAAKFIKNPETVSRVLSGIESFNPSKFAQGLSFWAYMGFWNPAQLYKQAMGTANVMLLEPVKGTQAAIAYPLVRLARATKARPELQKEFIKGIKKVTQLTDDEVQGLFKHMDRYATEFSSGLFIGAEDYSRALLRDSDGLMNKFWQSQYFFMREGNAANFYVADIAAYLAKKNQGSRAINAYADDLFVNMTKASASDVQTGVTSLFTQWLTYPMRMMEAMGSGRLSVAQKRRLLIGNIGIYGAGGTLGLNLYNSLTDEGTTPDLSLFLQNGLVGLAGKELGSVLDEGVGAFEVFKNTADIYDFKTGELSLPPVSAGAGVATFLNSFNYLFKLTKTVATDLTLDDLAKDIAEERFLPSSLKNTAKALLAFRYNRLINSRGVVKFDPTTTQKVFQALGFQPYETKAIRNMEEALMDQEKVIRDSVDSAMDYINAVNRYRIQDIELDDNFYRLVREEDRIIAELEASIVDRFGGDSDAHRKFVKAVSEAQYGKEKDLVTDTLKKGLGMSPARFEAAKYLFNLGEQ